MKRATVCMEQSYRKLERYGEIIEAQEGIQMQFVMIDPSFLNFHHLDYLLIDLIRFFSI